MRISYSVKYGSGEIHTEESISATRVDLHLERRKERRRHEFHID